MYKKKVDSSQKVNEMLELVQSITDIENKYFLTNIVAKLIALTFDVEKEKYTEEIRVLCCYERCTAILKQLKKIFGVFYCIKDLIDEYKNILHTERV